MQVGVCMIALVHDDIEEDADWIALMQHTAQVTTKPYTLSECAGI